MEMDRNSDIERLLVVQLTTRRELLRRVGAAGALLATPAVITACGGGSTGSSALGTSTPGGGGTVDLLSWAVSDDPVSMDYAFTYDYNTLAIVPNICESLLRFSTNGQLLPGLAEKWEQKSALEYVYQIRSGVKFHDGSTLTADDVSYSLNRHLDPKVGSYLATYYTHVATIEATGPLEVTVKLSAPDALWHYAVATTAGSVASKAFIEAHGKKFGTPAVGTIGTGPFKFVSWTVGQNVTVEKFDAYWDRGRVPKVKKLVVNTLKDPATTISALGSGQIDGTFNLAGRDVKATETMPSINVTRAGSLDVQMLVFNTQKPPFDDVRVRQALSYAIDKAGMLKAAYANEGDLMYSAATPAMWTFAKEKFSAAYAELPKFAQDITKAKQLINEAGAAGTSAKILTNSAFQDQAVAVQAAGKEIGLSLQIDQVPNSNLLAEEFSGKSTRSYELAVAEWASDVPDPAGTLFVCFYSKNLVTNTSLYSNPEVDNLLEQQNAEADQNKRADLLIQAQSKIVEDQPWVIFYSPSTTMVLNSRVGGYALSPLWIWSSWAADLSGT
jgi:peptide/nickel transport system substrate-binding protein